MSVYNDILNTVKTAIDGLALLDWNAAVVPVKVRKLPVAEEALDAVPMVCVCPSDQPEQVEPANVEAQVYVTYPVEVVFIAPGNRSWTAHLAEYLDWREKVRRRFQAPTQAGVPSVFDTEIVPKLVIDRLSVNSNYDYGGLVIRFRSCEVRDN